MIAVRCKNERREDVPFLVDYYIEKIADEYGQPKKIVDKEAMDLLTNSHADLRRVP